MYCVNCGVKLADTQEKCPLCATEVYHPAIERKQAQPFYPKEKMPPQSAGVKALCGAGIILLFIPLLVCFFADFFRDGVLNWFGYVAGGLLVGYVTVGLPMWFQKPNPVIFVPCDFAAATVYLLYICIATGGNWFLPFALPVVGGLCLITCAVVTLVHYLHAGKLYIFGGGFMALGAFLTGLEFLIKLNFGLPFSGWSLYALISLLLLGGLLMYLAINRSARETLERKLFF